MAYEVNTPVFDGPFDLLLHLILQEEVDIHEVSLLRIVEAYLVEVQKMQTFDLEIATDQAKTEDIRTFLRHNLQFYSWATEQPIQLTV